MVNRKKQEESRLDSLCEFLVRNRNAIFIFILAVTGVFLYGAFHIRGEVILQHLFPYDHPYLRIQWRFFEHFGGGGSGVVIGLKSKQGDIFNEKFLEKLKKMTDEVIMWEEVYRVHTVSIASRSVKVVKPLKKGEIHIEPLMWPEIPKTSETMEVLKTHIFSNPAYRGNLISEDGTAALLMTEFKENISYAKVFDMLQRLRKDYSDQETSVHIVGFPMMMGWIYSLKPQMYFVFTVSIIIMIIILYLMFRNVVGMIAPIVNALILTIWGLGFIGFIKVNFSPLLYVLAFLVGARMVSNSVQITYRYFEELHASGNNKILACYNTMRSMMIPNIAAVTTDAAGFLVLLLAKIVLMMQLAIIMSFWMITIIMTAFMVPTICSMIPLKVASENYARDKCQVGQLSRVIMKIGQFSISPGKYVVSIGVVLILLFSFWEMRGLKIGDPTPGTPLLWPHHPYNKDQEIINQLFKASSENFTLFYEGEPGSVYDPLIFTTFEAFDRHMKKALPDIYKSSISLIDMVKMVNLVLHDGDQFWYQLPRNQDLAMALIGYVRERTDRGTLNRFIDGGVQRAQITLFFSDHTSENLLRIREAAYNFFKNHPMNVEKGEFFLGGGRIGMEIALNEEMKRAHAIIELMVLGAIFILCAISFSSITAGLMLTLPLIFAQSLAAAYMAWANIGLSVNSLPVAAISVGVGVDFAIYLYSRCKEEFPLQRGDWAMTIIQSICTTGKAVIFTGLTIISPVITWYFFSDMKFQAQVGFFLAMIMGANMILALTLHPLLIYIIKPAFITQKKNFVPITEESF